MSHSYRPFFGPRRSPHGPCRVGPATLGQARNPYGQARNPYMTQLIVIRFSSVWMKGASVQARVLWTGPWGQRANKTSPVTELQFKGLVEKYEYPKGSMGTTLLTMITVTSLDSYAGHVGPDLLHHATDWSQGRRDGVNLSCTTTAIEGLTTQQYDRAHYCQIRVTCEQEPDTQVALGVSMCG